MNPEVPVGERLAVVESQIRDFRAWQRETDRTLDAVRDSVNRIEAQMISQEAFKSVTEKLDTLATDLSVKEQVETALDERDVRGATFKTKVLNALPTAILAVISILVILNTGHV